MSYRVLICDDEPHITRAVTMKLSKGGFEVEAHQDGLAAWDNFHAFQPHLVITDYEMPRMNGMQLIQHIRQSDIGNDVPIIFLTAKGYEVDENHLPQGQGEIRIMSKPFSPRELLSLTFELTSSQRLDQD
ncbi:response regulator [Calycomorphotria hydatis]|uniref:Response regulator MprA n=1 Tax=Calycomorphotria hydatis TaxID=2528027 RepID=A0A517TB52_9PLAN|nr:response regulator [Calycomorphotria hydatis]QDT65595.1 Response regulator MprA [Calycomorphotria hydatis]